MIILIITFSVLMYLNIDPLKSCLFLIRFLIFYLIFLSLNSHIWYSYFICLIFVRGILAILVYFTSLSNLNLKSFSFNFIVIRFLIFFIFIIFIFSLKFLGLRFLFLNFHFFLFVWILGILVGFFNFLRFIISFLKGLRKF